MKNMPTRYHYDYKSICVKKRDYLALAKKKQEVEKAIGKRLNWSDFLLFVAGLKSMAEEHRISQLAHGRRPDDPPEVPSFSDATQLEEIVARQVEMAMSQMKKRR